MTINADPATLSAVIASSPILFEIDGLDVSPSTVDARLALALASSYFALLAGAASLNGGPLVLTGLSVVDKCVAFRSETANPPLARLAAQTSSAWVDGSVDTPKGLRSLRDGFVASLATLPAGMRTKVIIGEGSTAFSHALVAPPVRLAERRARSITELRVRAIRVGGKDPTALLHDTHEDYTFTVKITEQEARALGPHLYQEIDAVLDATFDENSRVVDGTLIEWRPLVQEGGLRVLREWFERHPSGVRGDRMVAELGRRR